MLHCVDLLNLSVGPCAHLNLATSRPGPWPSRNFTIVSSLAVFIFLYFLFSFFTKIYFRFRNLQEYTPAPRCRATGTWSPLSGAAGAFLQKNSRRICAKASGRLVARQRGGRLPLHYLRVGCPPPLTCITKITEKRKEREGGREAKPCQIFKSATAGNQNSSTLYKQFML